MSKRPNAWWPIWFPYPSSWGKAVGLVIPMYLGASVVFTFEFWRYFCISILLLATRNDGAWFFLGISGVFLLVATLWFLFLVTIYSLLLRLLWNNPPQWLKPPHWANTLKALGLGILATLPIVAVFFFYILSITSLESLAQSERIPRLHFQQILLHLGWVWFFTAAYLYQADQLIRTRFQPKE